MRHLIAFALLLLPAASWAQSGTIAPGMTRSQVVAALGEPATSRAASEFSYLFYVNRCGRACGMNDLVVLRRDSVIDAIFRSPGRRYTGVSSSPAPLSPAAARAHKSAPVTRPAVERDVSSPTRLRPGKANDTRPSIPAGEPPVRPVPQTPAKPSTS